MDPQRAAEQIDPVYFASSHSSSGDAAYLRLAVCWPLLSAEVASAVTCSTADPAEQGQELIELHGDALKYLTPQVLHVLLMVR